MNSGESNRECDPEVGEESEGEEESCQSSRTGSTPGRESKNASRSGGSRNPHSLGFLAEDFGRPSQWAWLFPWMKKDNYNNRFKEAILGSSNHSATTKTWHATLCPWFNAAVKAEEEFIQEMRTLSRLRHPCITTVLGAVTSRNHDPMLVMEFMENGSLHDLLQNETMHLSGYVFHLLLIRLSMTRVGDAM